MDDWRVMLEIMSPRLRGEVAMMQCGPWINNVPFFRGAPETFIVDVALKLKSETFPQGEEIVRAGAISTRLYIVERGVVGGKGRVFTSGKTFGEEVLNGGAPTAFTARAMTYCDVFSLPGTVIERIASAFPVMQRRLRTAGCRGMMKDALSALDHAWGQVARGHATSPDVPEALGEDASLADEAVKRRTDKVFAFALSLAAREGGGGGGSGRRGKPSLPSDSGARFKKRPNAEGSFRVRRPRGRRTRGEGGGGGDERRLGENPEGAEGDGEQPGGTHRRPRAEAPQVRRRGDEGPRSREKASQILSVLVFSGRVSRRAFARAAFL